MVYYFSLRLNKVEPPWNGINSHEFHCSECTCGPSDWTRRDGLEKDWTHSNRHPRTPLFWVYLHSVFWCLPMRQPAQGGRHARGQSRGEVCRETLTLCQQIKPPNVGCANSGWCALCELLAHTHTHTTSATHRKSFPITHLRTCICHHLHWRARCSILIFMFTQNVWFKCLQKSSCEPD